MFLFGFDEFGKVIKSFLLSGFLDRIYAILSVED